MSALLQERLRLMFGDRRPSDQGLVRPIRVAGRPIRVAGSW